VVEQAAQHRKGQGLVRIVEGARVGAARADHAVRIDPHGREQ